MRRGSRAPTLRASPALGPRDHRTCFLIRLARENGLALGRREQVEREKRLAKSRGAFASVGENPLELPGRRRVQHSQPFAQRAAFARRRMLLSLGDARTRTLHEHWITFELRRDGDREATCARVMLAM